MHEPSRVLVTHNNPHMLAALVRREAMVPLSRVELLPTGQYGIMVHQTRPLRRRWVRPAVAVAAGAAGVGGVVWLLFLVWPILLGAALAVTGVWLVLPPRRAGCEITIIHRHR